jgi:hypothetical protein
MERFSHVVVGYHGCTDRFAQRLLVGELAVEDWKPSENRWDWLGSGIYFWEESPRRAMRWAEKTCPTGESPAVLGAHIDLGHCFDCLAEGYTALLKEAYEDLAETYRIEGRELPQNRGRDADFKVRELDCLVVNHCLARIEETGAPFETVRSAFLEGEPSFPGSMLFLESHIQIAVRDSSCIRGVFRPNLSHG